MGYNKKATYVVKRHKWLIIKWEHTGSNRGPSACKADALNQLSYAPFIFGECKYNIRDEYYSKNLNPRTHLWPGTKTFGRNKQA